MKVLIVIYCICIVFINLMTSKLCLAEQRIVFECTEYVYNTRSIAPPSPREWCEKLCRNKSTDIAQALSDGWRVVTAIPHKEIEVEKWQDLEGIDAHFGCICKGNSFVLEKTDVTQYSPNGSTHKRKK